MLLLCALIVGSSSVWATDVTFTAGSDKGTNGNSGNPDTMTKGAVTISGTSLATTTTEYRIYSGSSLTISVSGGTITDIVVTSTANKGSSNGPDKISTKTGTYSTTTGSKVGTWTGSATSVTFSASAQCRATSILVTYTPASSDPSSDVAFAYAARSLDLKDASSFTQTATTADGYAAAGGEVSYSMTTNTAGATIDEGTGEVTPTKAGTVTVQAEAAAVTGFSASYASYTLTVTDTREWDVTCHIGNNTSVENRTSGATLSLDDPTPICGMAFVGWSSTSNVASPTWVSNSTKVSGNMTLYAIYEYEPGEYSYHLVESAQDDWRGDYLIAYSSSVFANGQASGTSGIGSASTVVDPDDKLSGKVVDGTWGDNYYVTLEAKDDDDLSKGYVLKTQDGFYNYQTSNNNGLGGTSKNKATAAAYPITVKFVSSAEINLELSSGPVFRYNSSEGYFRYYKSSSYSGMGKVYLYKRTEDVAPVYSLGLTESVAVTSVGYATYVSSNPLDFTEAGIYAYIAKANGRTGVTFERIKKVPANTGVLLYYEGGTTEGILIFDGTGADATTGNVFKVGTGAAVASVDAENENLHNYILNKPDKKPIGFYKAANQTVATNRAYIQIDYSVVAGVKEFIALPGSEETAVEAVKANAENGVIFNLAGQRIQKLQRGINIVNGRKVVVK